MVGFVFFEKSPRCVGSAQARDLAARARQRAEIVALCVDADDETLAAIVAATEPDYLQLHGRESPERVAVLQLEFGVSAIKAIGIAEAADFAKAQEYKDVADALLIDAKPPNGAVLPGGNGVPFNWRLAREFAPRKPWLLSGGLDAGNVAPDDRAQPGRGPSTYPRASRSRRGSRMSRRSGLSHRRPRARGLRGRPRLATSRFLRLSSRRISEEKHYSVTLIHDSHNHLKCLLT